MAELTSLSISKERLPKDFAAKVSVKFNCTEDYVRKVAKGIRLSEEIFYELLKMAEEEKQYRKLLQKRVHALSK